MSATDTGTSATAVDPQPPAPGCVADQAPDQLDVGVDPPRQLTDREGPVEAVRDIEAAQRRVIESLEHLHRRRGQPRCNLATIARTRLTTDASRAVR